MASTSSATLGDASSAVHPPPPPPTLYLPTPSPLLPPPRILSAAHDLIPTFGLLPIYNEAVRPYLKERPPPVPPASHVSNSAGSNVSNPAQAGRAAVAGQGSPPAGGNQVIGKPGATGGGTPRLSAGTGTTPSALQAGSPPPPGQAAAGTGAGSAGPATNTPRNGPAGAGPSLLNSAGSNSAQASTPGAATGGASATIPNANTNTSNTAEPPRPPRTWAHFVEDLPGKVRPTKAELRGTRTSEKADHSMRDIIFKPETTIHRIVPFDEETLRNFVLAPGAGGEEIDVRRLESDDEEEQVQRKKKRKQKKADLDGAKRQKR